ncbi:MAG: hypothetical protein PVF73_05500 [Bacteroidales bacterium]|jgi:predicted esterase
MKTIQLLIILSAICKFSYSQAESGFESLMKTYHERFDSNQISEAIDLLEKSLQTYPDRHYEINKELAIAYGHLGEFQKSFEIWNKGFESGNYYCIIPQWDIYKPFNNIDGFEEIYKKDREIREKAILNTSIKIEILKPDNYDSIKDYPLLIVLHGGGSSNETSMKYWRSSSLTENYIIAYLQSYLTYDMKSFGWSWDRPRTKEELKKAFKEIKNKYSIDTARVVIGGMSAGGYVALRTSIHDLFSNIGFIAVCPDLRWGYPELSDIQSTKNKIKGYIISGDNDMCLESIENWTHILDDSNLDYRYNIISDMGHEYPIEFSKEIEIALKFINEE